MSQTAKRGKKAKAPKTGLADDLGRTDPFGRGERLFVVEQAQILLEEAYVHLPMKRVMHAIDPVQRLRLLRHRIRHDEDAPVGAAFHHELTEIFTSNRDLHTAYTLPEPYCRMTAYLPFFVEVCYEDERPTYVVTKLIPGFEHPTFRPGVEVLYWNGIPIDRAVEINGERNAGSNRAARHACGLNALTIRPMLSILPPDEAWVHIVYRTGGEATERIRLDWEVFSPPPGSSSASLDDFEAISAALAFDVQTDAVHHAKKALFAPSAVEAERRAASGERPSNSEEGILPTTMPTVFRAKPVRTRFGTFGYLRVFTFGVRSAPEFIAEALHLIDELPSEGLILDMRGNPGGLIPASEGLLQTLTPRHIEPAPFQFVSSSFTRALCERCAGEGALPDLDLTPWLHSIERAVRTGATYSNAFAISNPEQCNAIGQRVHGPVVLITDALCYSATDLFAAGFRDHGAGTILGCSANTGAGGANVWSHDFVRLLMGRSDARLGLLPGGAGINVSIRRSLRVGPHAGTPLEDLGVIPDEIHRMTRRDVLEGNADLLDRAGQILAGKRSFRLALGVASRSAEGVAIRLDTKNLSLVDLYVDGHPAVSVSTKDGVNECVVPGGVGLGNAALLEARGFDLEGEHVVSRKQPLEP